MANYYLPSKINAYLRRLLLNYDHSGPKELASILKHGRIAVSPDTNRSYNFGQENFGHTVVIFLPPEHIAPISMKKQAELGERLREDLQECARGFEDEYVATVRMELEDEHDFLFDVSSSLIGPPPTDPDSLSFWTPGHVRLFISHRDSYKREAKALGNALAEFGISCFVAHDTIEPMESWQHQIEKGLETMEVFLALVTDDFHDSVWTNQEVGFAKAFNIPIICLKLPVAPKGFIAEKQALAGDIARPEHSANEIYKLLAEKVGRRDVLQAGVIAAFCESPSWTDTRIRFDRMEALIKKLSKDDVAKIQKAFNTNDQLHRAAYLYYGSKFLKFLTRTTGKQFKLDKGTLSEVETEADDIPF